MHQFAFLLLKKLHVAFCVLLLYFNSHLPPMILIPLIYQTFPTLSASAALLSRPHWFFPDSSCHLRWSVRPRTTASRPHCSLHPNPPSPLHAWFPRSEAIATTVGLRLEVSDGPTYMTAQNEVRSDLDLGVELDVAATGSSKQSSPLSPHYAPYEACQPWPNFMAELF